MNTLKRILYWIDKVEKAACGAGLVGLVILILLSALFRAFRISMSWNNDMAMLLLAWTAFLGADVAWRHGQIIGVDLLTRNLPIALQHIIKILINIIVLLALVLIFYFGITLAWSERVSQIQSLHIPTASITFSIIVASFSMVFSTFNKIREAVLNLAGKSTANAEGEEN